ncbi:MAG TPA: hypothetical protein QF753_13690 [Victivallales bacterium]|nr:hypothetical protein [Victivallales bacterium]
MKILLSLISLLLAFFNCFYLTGIAGASVEEQIIINVPSDKLYLYFFSVDYLPYMQQSDYVLPSAVSGFMSIYNAKTGMLDWELPPPRGDESININTLSRNV